VFPNLELFRSDPDVLVPGVHLPHISRESGVIQLLLLKGEGDELLKLFYGRQFLIRINLQLIREPTRSHNLRVSNFVITRHSWRNLSRI
jgi:hypothetical protein